MSNPRSIGGPYFDDNLYKIAYIKIYYFPKIIGPLARGEIARANFSNSMDLTYSNWTRPDKTGQGQTRLDKAGQDRTRLDLILYVGKIGSNLIILDPLARGEIARASSYGSAAAQVQT